MFKHKLKQLILTDKFFFFFHGVTARGGPKPLLGFYPEGFLVGKCAFCSE
jgi:hypothetical protein